jgi:hypothetical protein
MGLSCDGCGDSISSFDKVYCENCKDCEDEKSCEKCNSDISSSDDAYCSDCYDKSITKLGFDRDDGFVRLIKRLEDLSAAGKSISLEQASKLNEFATEFIKET